MKPPVRPKRSVGNVEQSETARRVSIFLMRINPIPKTAIFLNLRTLEQKNPLFSMLTPWEPKTTIPENILILISLIFQIYLTNTQTIILIKYTKFPTLYHQSNLYIQIQKDNLLQQPK